MSDEQRWTFYGYLTPAGTPDVQQWFDGLPDESKDEVRDTLLYLRVLPIVQWRLPEFERLGDGLSEVRCKVNVLKQIIRIYGAFLPDGARYSYTFLLGTSAKKVNNDLAAKADAYKRLSRIKNGQAGIDVFRLA